MRVAEGFGGRRTALSLFVATGLATMAVPAMAQTAQTVQTAPDTAESEIVVTATKQGAASIHNIPLSIQALSSDDLSKRAAIDFNDFANLVPGLTSEDTGPGDKRYIIRGIASTGPGTVGVYLDEAIITGENDQDGGGQQTDIKLFDIDRVEVLKGPQGTTFGSSSLGGTIRYITNKPNLQTNSLTISNELRATDGADLGYQGDGAANLVIVPGRLAVRLAGIYTELPGYIDSPFGKGVDGELTSGVRGMARLEVTKDLTLTVLGMEQRTNQDSKTYFNTVDFFGNPPPEKYYQTQIAQTPFDDRNQIYSGVLEYDKSFGKVTATASRFIRDLDFVRDASPIAALLLGLPYPDQARSIISQPKHRQVDNYELRYASTFAGPVQVLFGLFGSDERRAFRSTWQTVDATGAIDPNFAGINLLDRTVNNTISERAVFGELNYEIVPGLKFIFGGRYYYLKQTQTTDDLVSAGGGPGTGPGLPSKVSVNGFIPRYNLSYEPNSMVNVYVQAAKGFRAGGNNDQTAAALANVNIPAGYNPDTLWNYETGLKLRAFGSKLFADVAAYYIDWQNIQIQLEASPPGVSTAGYPYTGNGGAATVKGVEWSLEGRPTQGLSVSVSGNYNDAELARTNAAPAIGNKGDPLPYVPRLTLTGSSDYSFPLWISGMRGWVGGDISYISSRATDFNATSPAYRPLPSNTLVALRAGVRAHGWSTTLAISNLFNQTRPVNYTALAFGVTPDEIYINSPRTVSLRVTKQF